LGRLATRREFVAGGFVAGGLAAAGVAVAADAAAADAPVSDGEALSKALEVERLMVLAYRRVLASGALASDIERAVAPYLAHEVEHVSTVASRLTAMGESPATGPLSLDAAGAMLSKHNIPGSLTDLHSQNDCLRLVVDLESLAEGVYFTALKTLSKPGLQQLAAQIMACEAQHWTAVSGLRNPGQYVKAVPWPFVTGSS
jgi:Ferritin-like domain